MSSKKSLTPNTYHAKRENLLIVIILDTEWTGAGRPRLADKKILAAKEERITQNGCGQS
jgi:hypothetical protein